MRSKQPGTDTVRMDAFVGFAGAIHDRLGDNRISNGFLTGGVWVSFDDAAPMSCSFAMFLLTGLVTLVYQAQ